MSKNTVVDDFEKEPAYKMGDDLIAVVRELVQLAILTGTNIVDHLRAIQVEVDPDTNKLVPTMAYIESYNEMVEGLVQKAEEAQAQAESQLHDHVADELRAESLEDPTSDLPKDLN